jgi:RNA polymerase sigma-70 factor (ECF subfamily)
MASRGQELRWVVRAQSGDADALDALLGSIQEPLYGYILSLVHDPHRAQDVLQEVLILVVQKLYWLREPRVFRSWVYRIASRESFRCLKKEQRSTLRTEADALRESIVDEPKEDRVDPELLLLLPGLLERVSPASRAVLSLHYLGGMTLREVADVLEISPGAAKARLGYGLAVLRKKMGVAPCARCVGPTQDELDESRRITAEESKDH